MIQLPGSGQGFGDFEHRSGSAGVVVGSVVNLSDASQAGALGSQADVVVVSSDDDEAVPQLRVCSREHRQHVAKSFLGEFLVEISIATGGFQADASQLLDEIGSGGLSSL